MTDETKPDSSQTNSNLVPINQSQSNLYRIEESFYEKIKAAKTPEEAQKYFNLVEQTQGQIERKRYADLQIQETQNQIKYERKIKIYQESIKITFSLISLITGLSLIKIMPLVAPLLIILGIIKPLGYCINEVVTLLNSLNESVQASRLSKKPTKQEKTTEINQS